MESLEDFARTQVLANSANKLVGTFPSIVHGLAGSRANAANSLACALGNASECTLQVSLRSRTPGIRASLFQVANSSRGSVADIVSSLAGGASGTLTSIADGLGRTLRRLVDLLGHRSRVAACRRVEFT